MFEVLLRMITLLERMMSRMIRFMHLLGPQEAHGFLRLCRIIRM